MGAHYNLPKNHSYPKDAHIDDKLILLKDGTFDIAEYSNDGQWYSVISDLNVYPVDEVKCWYNLPKETEGN